jgi:hypothetical protein
LVKNIPDRKSANTQKNKKINLKRISRKQDLRGHSHTIQPVIEVIVILLNYGHINIFIKNEYIPDGL